MTETLGPLQLPFVAPYPVEPVMTFLADRAVADVETVEGTTYRRSMRLAGGPALVELTAAAGGFACRLALSDAGDERDALQRCRALLDLDCDPAAVAEVLGASPWLLAAVTAEPGRRVVGAVDGFEALIRALLGQQVSVAGARTVLGRLVANHGEAFEAGSASMRLFPRPERLAEASLEDVRIPDRRRQAIRTVS